MTNDGYDEVITTYFIDFFSHSLFAAIMQQQNNTQVKFIIPTILR